MRLVLGYILGVIYKLLSLTWRYEINFEDPNSKFEISTRPKKSIVIGHWHGDELALVGIGAKSFFLTMASHSKDGQIMNTALKTMGFETVRGSSSKGASRAFIALIKKMKQKSFFVSFAMDGPKGPRLKAKQGVVQLAIKTQSPIYQVLVDCNSKIDIPNTWNKTYVPMPFAKIRIKLIKIDQPNESTLKQINERTNY